MSLVATGGHPEAEKLVMSMPLSAMGGGDYPKQWKGQQGRAVGCKMLWSSLLGRTETYGPAGVHELGYSAPDWHKTPLSDIGSEGRANEVLFRLDVSQLQAPWEVLVLPALSCWCWGSWNEDCLGGKPEVSKCGNAQHGTPLCQAETSAGGKVKSSASLKSFEHRMSHKK